MKKKPNKIIFIILFPLMISIIYSCATVPITGRKQLSIIPMNELLSLSETNYRQILSESKLSNNPNEINQVKLVGRKIANAAEDFLKDSGLEQEIKNYVWEFNVIDDTNTVNAFCMSGGKIVVYTGILKITQDEPGLAVVLGHEVAHAIANHAGERMSQLLVTQLGGIALSKALNEKPKETQELAMAAYGISTNIGVLLPYSRKHETEADRIGIILMARAGYNPEHAIKFWERMKALDTGAGFEFLSTHPTTERRINDIKSYIPEAMKYYKN